VLFHPKMTQNCSSARVANKNSGIFINIKKLLWIMVLGMCFFAEANAGCPIEIKNQKDADRWFENWLVTYDGEINNAIPIRMTLVFSKEKIVGRYFYAKYLEDISLSGKASGGRSAILYEIDKNGKEAAQFNGEFLEEDPRGSYGPGNKLICEVFSGTWKNLVNGQEYPFYVKLSHAQAGKLGKRYPALGSDSSVERVAQSFVEAVKANEREKVATLIHFPTGVNDGRKSIRILNNEKEFLEVYDLLINEHLIKEMKEAIPKHMPCCGKYDLARIGDTGGAWVGQDLKIWLPGWHLTPEYEGL
jgi:hypothetical protein